MLIWKVAAFFIFYFFPVGEKFELLADFEEAASWSQTHFTHRPEDLWCKGREGRTPGGERKTHTEDSSGVESFLALD